MTSGFDIFEALGTPYTEVAESLTNTVANDIDHDAEDIGKDAIMSDSNVDPLAAAEFEEGFQPLFGRTITLEDLR